MRSLLAWLVIGLLLSLAGVFLVQWSMVQSAVDTMLVDIIAHELEQDAEELFSSLTVLADGKTSLAITHYDPPFLKPLSGRYFQVMLGEQSSIRSPSLQERNLPVLELAPGTHLTRQVPGAQGERLLLYGVGFEFRGRQITIVLAADLAPIRATLSAFMQRYTEVSIGLFLALLAIQAAIVRLALWPLRRVEADVAGLERGDIKQLGEGVPVEILPLVREVNRLLALLARRLIRSREALGNLAHALKAPLTVLLNIAEDERLRAVPDLHMEMREQLLILRERVNAELRRARVAGARPADGACAVAQTIAALVVTLQKLYRERVLGFEVQVPADLRFAGDAEDLAELLGNLLDNACKWARSRVRITARGDNGLVFRVEDDGPGCAPEELQRIAERGERLDEATAGHGLGLSIARGIVAAYDGKLQLGRSAGLGGLEVSVTLPVRASPPV